MRIDEILNEMYQSGQIEILESGLIRFKSKRKRGRIRKRGLRFSINVLRNLAWLVNDFHKAKVHFWNIDLPVLAYVIRRVLEVNKATSYQYANFLVFLYQNM